MLVGKFFYTFNENEVRCLQTYHGTKTKGTASYPTQSTKVPTLCLREFGIQLPIRSHYVNFRRRGNPRRFWTCVIPPSAGRQRPTVCRKSAKIAPNRWGIYRHSRPFFCPRWDDTDIQADVVQPRGRQPGRVQGRRNRRSRRKFGPPTHQRQSEAACLFGANTGALLPVARRFHAARPPAASAILATRTGRSRLLARGIGLARIPLKQGFHPRQALTKIGHVRADGLRLVFHAL